jgi:hypothetical protein
MQTFLPPVDPITTGFDIVVGIVSIIGALFGGIFGGGADPNIAKAFNGLRDQMVAMGNKLLKFGWQIAQGVGAIFNAIKWLWGNVVGALVKAVRAIRNLLDRLYKNILKPMQDVMAAQRKAILDLYNRFIRPIIIAIEKIRRIIHLFQLLHIHIFDRLDRTLARIEGKILAPIYALLYRVNTLGNWISFIINGYGLIFRGLLLGSVNANRGGTFSLLANAPLYGMKPLPFTPNPSTTPTAPVTFNSLLATANTQLVNTASGLALDSPTRAFIACFTATGSIGDGSPSRDFLRCFFVGTPFEGSV